MAVLERDLNDLLDLFELYRQGDADLEKAQPDLIEKINDLAKRIDLNYSLSNLPCLIERTREGLRRIERIVKELRLFARVDEGDWNEVDLNPGIESTINIIKGNACKKGVRIVMDLGALPAIRCRSARIQQVIINLLTNAIDACAAETGVVTVHTETEPEARGIPSIFRTTATGSTRQPRRHLRPVLHDQAGGSGNRTGPKHQLRHHRRARRPDRGSIQPGKGARFTIHLPIEPRGERGESHARHLQPRWPHRAHAPGTPSPRAGVAPQPLPASPAASPGELAP